MASLILVVLIAVQAAGLIAVLMTGGFVTSIAGIPIRATNAAAPHRRHRRGARAAARDRRPARDARALASRSRRSLLSRRAAAAGAVAVARAAAAVARARRCRASGSTACSTITSPGFDGLRVPGALRDGRRGLSRHRQRLRRRRAGATPVADGRSSRPSRASHSSAKRGSRRCSSTRRGAMAA